MHNAMEEVVAALRGAGYHVTSPGRYWSGQEAEFAETTGFGYGEAEYNREAMVTVAGPGGANYVFLRGERSADDCYVFGPDDAAIAAAIADRLVAAPGGGDDGGDYGDDEG